MKQKISIWLYIVFILYSLFGCVTDSLSKQELAKEYYNIGNAYWGVNKHEKALTYYKKALELDKNMIKTSYNLARLYIDMNNYEKAISILNSIIKQDTDNIMILETLGYIHYLQGNVEKAEKIYVEILRKAPKRVNSLFNYARILEFKEEYETALINYKKVFDIEPDLRDVGFTLAKLEYQLKKYDSSKQHIEAYLENNNTTEARLLLSKLYSQKQMYEQAMEELHKALEKDAKHAEALFEKAKLQLTVIENDEDGLINLEKAIKNGFSNKENITQLLNDENLVAKPEVKAVLTQHNALPESEKDVEGQKTDGTIKLNETESEKKEPGTETEETEPGS